MAECASMDVGDLDVNHVAIDRCVSIQHLLSCYLCVISIYLSVYVILSSSVYESVCLLLFMSVYLPLSPSIALSLGCGPLQDSCSWTCTRVSKNVQLQHLFPCTIDWLMCLAHVHTSASTWLPPSTQVLHAKCTSVSLQSSWTTCRAYGDVFSICLCSGGVFVCFWAKPRRFSLSSGQFRSFLAQYAC